MSDPSPATPSELSQLQRRNTALQAEIAALQQQLATAKLERDRLNDQVMDAFAVHTFEGIIVDVNKRMCEMMRCSRESLIGKSIAEIDDLWPKERLAAERDRLKELLPTTVEGLLRRSDDTTFPVVVRLDYFHDGERELFIGLVRDDSARKQVEADLERFFTLSPEMLCIAGVDGYFKRVNQAFTDVLGFTRDQLLSEPFLTFVHADDQAKTLHQMERLRAGKKTVDFRNRYRTANGEWRWFDWNAMSVLEHGLIYAAAHDITKQIEADEAIKASELRFRTIFNAAGDAIFLHDGDSLNLLDVNEKACELLGYSRKELLQLDVGTISENKPPYTMEDAARWLRAAEQQERPQLFEWRSRHRNGHLIWTEVHIRHHREKERSRFIVVARDISQRKEAEQNLKEQKQVLRNLLDLQEQERKLTSYEIHDGLLQNVIGAKMVVEGVHEQLPASDLERRAETADALARLSFAIDEGRRLISNLRPMIIDELGILQAIDFLVSEAETKNELQIHFVPKVQFARLPSRLEDSLFRIVREALINVKHHAKTDEAEVRLTQDGERILLTIKDHGAGFDPDQVPADHFGLEGIRQRAKLFGGFAEIESKPGQGTTVRVEMVIPPTELGNGPKPS